MGNRLVLIQRFGQSIWYDNIRRGLITSGELQELVTRGGVLGVTSNPAIFEKAIAGSDDYDPEIKALVRQGVGNAQAIFEELAIHDIQLAADVLHPTYSRCEAKDGYVSLEVSPHLAHDTEGSVAEAMRLHAAIGRDNVMIKVPATEAGIPAVRRLIAAGIPINVTLIFSCDVYAAVSDAYLSGLEEWVEGGGDPRGIASVASFFVSRVDSSVDARLEHELDATRDAERRSQLKSLVGTVAIANSRIAFGQQREMLESDRWRALAKAGAQPQRLLWASTGTKNPKYSKTLYIDELIGSNTVNTVPVETYNAYASSGNPRAKLEENWDSEYPKARERIELLESLGIELAAITDQLLDEGLGGFSHAFDKLLAAVEHKRQALLGPDLARQHFSLGDAQADVDATLDSWRSDGTVRRLWQADSSLWTGGAEDQWLGWLHVVDAMRDQVDALKQVAADVREMGCDHVVLLGMGGSSLCPDVLRRTFGRQEGWPELTVIDSVVPAQVRKALDAIDPARSVFVVSSKSGGTTETDVLRRIAFERVKQAVGDSAGSHFIAITDPHTTLHELAKREGFGHILHGVPSIGGRYSALSNFGMLPAALMGIDVEEFLESADIMVQSCASCVPPEVNPGVVLGVALGRLARRGRDKLTILTSPSFEAFGSWLEQLIAESTGKRGVGIIPVESEGIAAPDAYGADRLFVYAKLASDECEALEESIDELESAGHPVVRLVVEDPIDLGQAFFRWELATAVAGSILEVDPFDQPDVEAAKIATAELMQSYESSGQLPEREAVESHASLQLFVATKHAESLRGAAAGSLEGWLRGHLGSLRPGDYFAIQAYLEMSDAHHEPLQAIRHAVRDTRRVATTLGYGPRFLHSTGQLHKGGPNSGVFLQITSGAPEDLAIPGRGFGLRVLSLAQALGDFAVLEERERRVVRVHLTGDVAEGLVELREAVEHALG